MHPNTVRHRLRRISAATGRSLTAPRDVAELCLALEAARQHARLTGQVNADRPVMARPTIRVFISRVPS